MICPICEREVCSCDVDTLHKPDCRFRKSAQCAVGIECEHGYDLCPICDKCNCEDIE